MLLEANQREGMPFGNAARLSGHCYHLASNKALALTGEEMVTKMLMVKNKQNDRREAEETSSKEEAGERNFPTQILSQRKAHVLLAGTAGS